MKSKINNSIFLVLMLILSSHSNPLFSLDPTIINGDVILCPNSQETLVTQEYDSYQWYKDGNAITGATAQIHIISYSSDLLSSFSVFVTLGDQSAMSPSIFVDGWVFNPIVVSSYGQGFWFVGDGWEMCEEHELYFEVMQPYTTAIQWYRDGTPIAGANEAVYQVTQTGTYTVSGAPGLCPNYVQYSLPLPVVVHKPPTPVITQSYDTLFTSIYPGQWYFGLSPIPGATGQFILPESIGNYRFLYTDGNGCSEMSDSFYYEWDPVLVDDFESAVAPTAYANSNKLYFKNADGWTYELFTVMGDLISSGLIAQNTSHELTGLSSGIYLVRMAKGIEQRTIKIIKQ